MQQTPQPSRKRKRVATTTPAASRQNRHKPCRRMIFF